MRSGGVACQRDGPGRSAVARRWPAGTERLHQLAPRCRPGWMSASRTRPATATATSWPTSTTSGRSASGCRAGWRPHATFSTARSRCSARPDFRCTTRTLLELAEHHRPGHPEAAAGLLLQGLEMAMPASGASLGARVLASLTTAAAAAGDLPLAARAPAGGWPSPASSPGPEAAAIIHRLQVLDGGDLGGPKPSLSSRRPRERRSNTAFVQCGGARLSHKLRI